MAGGEAFVAALHEELRRLLVGEPDLSVKAHQKVVWPGEPKIYWPQADILILDRTFKVSCIIEYDDDCDPGRSLVKYWPCLVELEESEFSLYVVIGIWKKGNTIGDGYRRLAEFMGLKLKGLHPKFRYFLLQHQTESVQQVGAKIAGIVEEARHIVSDLEATTLAMEEYARGEGRDIEEVFKDIEKSRAL